MKDSDRPTPLRVSRLLLALYETQANMIARMLAYFQLINRRAGRGMLLAILALAGMGSLNAEGTYQKTKDKKTMVWNSAPKPGDAATWVGDRNREGYASGFGTLTWYTANGKIFARYYGHMIDGKFDGPVNAHSGGRVAHATFAEGKRISPWTGGNAKLRGGFADRRITFPPKTEPRTPEKREVVTETKKEARETPAETPKKEAAAPPKPKPTATPEIKRVAEKQPTPLPAASERPAPKLFPTPPTTPAPKRDVDESLQSLVGPPSSLHNTHPSETNPTGPLTKEEAVDLANTVARTHGYDPATYAAPKVQHNEGEETWSLSYEAKESGSGAAEKPLSITVDGKAKRASIVPTVEPGASP